MTYDIVVAHYGDVNVLKKMLEALNQIEKSAALQNIIVVENGVQSGAEALCNKLTNLPLHYLYTPTAGLSQARNLGIQSSDAQFIIFLDNDMGFSSDYLTAYEQAFADYGQDYFYGGPVTPSYEVKPESWKLDFVPPSVKGFNLGDKTYPVKESLFLGGNHALSKKIINYCKAHFGYVYEGESATGTSGGVGEEHRLQTRLLNSQFLGCYVAGAEVFHPVPAICFSHHWICNRRYRRGYTDSEKTRLLESKRQFKGVPLWIVKQFWICRVLECSYRILSPKKSLLYGVKRAWAQGLIKGVADKKNINDEGLS